MDRKGFGLIGVLSVVVIIGALVAGALYLASLKNKSAQVMSGASSTQESAISQLDTSSWQAFSSKYGFQFKYPRFNSTDTLDTIGMVAHSDAGGLITGDLAFTLVPGHDCNAESDFRNDETGSGVIFSGQNNINDVQAGVRATEIYVETPDQKISAANFLVENQHCDSAHDPYYIDFSVEDGYATEGGQYLKNVNFQSEKELAQQIISTLTFTR